MGALRRQEVQQDLNQSAPAEERRLRPYPRWMVVSGVILYCAACWMLVIAAGNWGVHLFQTAIAAQP